MLDRIWLTEETIHILWQGAGLTIALTLITSITSLVLGILAGTMRLSPKRSWRWLGSIHVEIHRNVPALVLILFWAFAMPNLFPAPTRQMLFFDNVFIHQLRQWTGLPLVYYGLAAGLALTLNTSAYIAELFRAGVETIAQEHVDAARSLGASAQTVYRKILFPQGFRAAFPAISTRLVHNMKNTALAAFVSVPELFHSTQTAITRSFRALEFLVLAAMLYLALSVIMASALGWVEGWLHRRYRRPMAL